MNRFKRHSHSILHWQAIFLVLSLMFSGCAAMNKNECLNARWQDIGYEDGTKGYTASRIGDYRKSCAEYNVTPNLDEYTQGRLQGLTQWCTPSNGYFQGTQGAKYNGICPEELEFDFERAMNHGRTVYNFREKLRHHESIIAGLNRDFHATEHQISIMEAELVSDRVDPRRRKMLLNEIRRSERDLGRLRFDISDAQMHLHDMRNNMRRLEAQGY